MPIAAIAVAAIADIGAAGAVSAAVAGTVTVASALEITAAVGATLGAIGAVTHDKTLSTVGMVMGGVGGLGQLAVSAGVFGEGVGSTVLFGDAPSTATAATAGAASGAANAATQTPQQGVVNSLGKVDNTAIPTASAPASSGTGGLINGAPTSAAGATNAAGTVPEGFVGKLADKIGSVFNSTPPTATPVSAATASAAPGVSATAQPGFWGKLINNPMVQYGLVQAGGAFLAGATNQLSDAQLKALQLQNANMSAPIPVASRVAPNITGSPTGIINAPAAGAVTGVPAR